MCALDDAEPVDWFVTEERRARKLHTCGECGRIIIPGEVYTCDRYGFKGKIHHLKVCPHCEVVRAWLRAECGGTLFGGALQDFYDHFEWPQYVDLLRINVMSRRRWMRPGRGLYPVPAMPMTAKDRVTERLLSLGPWQPDAFVKAMRLHYYG